MEQLLQQIEDYKNEISQFTDANAKAETEIEDAFNRELVSTNKLKGARSFYWSAITETELRYRVNNNLSLSFRPGFRFAISPITKNNDVNTFPYSFGLGLGLSYKFK